MGKDNMNAKEIVALFNKFESITWSFSIGIVLLLISPAFLVARLSTNLQVNNEESIVAVGVIIIIVLSLVAFICIGNAVRCSLILKKNS